MCKSMQVTEIGYEKSVILVLNGYANGKPTTLIQNISQLIFFRISMDRKEPEKPKRKIGFRTPDDD